MTIYVGIVGIDGSGKSTIVSALPAALSSSLGVVAGAAGDDFLVTAPDKERLGFRRDGLPWPARLSRFARRRAHRVVDDGRKRSYYELARRILQDGAARKLASRYGADVLVSDGNALLSSMGRAADPSDRLAAFQYLLDGVPFPSESAAPLPDLARVKWLQRLGSWLRLDGVWLPDMLIFLDLPPGEALERIRTRGGDLDRHVNLEDLQQARETCMSILEAFAAYRSVEAALRLPTSGTLPGETVEGAVAWVEFELHERSMETKRAPERPLCPSDA